LQTDDRMPGAGGVSAVAISNNNQLNPTNVMRRSLLFSLAICAGGSLLAGIAFHSIAQNSAATEERAATRTPDVVYVPTPHAVVEKMLEMAEIKEGDVIYDLGCGDARILVAAAKKYGVKAYGFDIDPVRVRESLENVRTNNVEHLVTIKQADIFTLDLREANVVTLYLLPELNVRLKPQLAKLKPGSRIVSHDFDMRGAKPVEVHRMQVNRDNSSPVSHTVYKWIVPWEREE
jgi:SAM-dependent methyltransferase